MEYLPFDLVYWIELVERMLGMNQRKFGAPLNNKMEGKRQGQGTCVYDSLYEQHVNRSGHMTRAGPETALLL